MKKPIMSMVMLLAFAVSNAEAQNPVFNRVVLSPYYQADSASYTFIGVSHPSLSGAVSQIGLRLIAVNANATVNNYVEFTVSANSTQRIFIVTTNHAFITPRFIRDANTSFITVSTGSGSSGSIRALSSHLDPLTFYNNDINNLSQLVFWGAIVATATNSGFSMEFIGDAHDSTTKPEPSDQTQPGADNGVGFGRGIN